MIFPKKLHWNRMFLISGGTIIFFSPKIWYYSLRGKWKMIFFKKKAHGNTIYSSNVPRRWSFQKNWTGTWSFLLWGKMAFPFQENMIIFLWTENKRWYSSKNTWKYDVFCILVKVVFLFPTNMKLPFCEKSKDNLFPKYIPTDDISGITEKDI